MRILLIDDDVTVVENLELYLRHDYFHAVESLTYVRDQEALTEVLRRFEPNGFVLDYGMERPGTEIYGWVRAWKPTVPIVFYTNYARSQERANMLRVGAKEGHILEKREVGLDIEAILDALKSQA